MERESLETKERSPAGWTVESLDLPAALPTIIDEPQELIAQDLPNADLILFLGESPQAPQVPDVAVAAGAKAVIVPIDNGYCRGVESHHSELIAAFARCFGRPKSKINPQTK